MQAAPGQGIVSSSVLISDDYDEIDWEFSGNNFGATSSSGQVQTNYYGKGNTGYYDRSTNADVNQPQASFHTYSVDWTKDQLVWSIDGNPVRTLLTSQCDNDTHQYPQTPMKLQLGLWDGGDPDGNPGTVNWAGGYTNLSQAPFTMYVKSVSITNYNPGYGYNYTDTTGSWESIQILESPLSSVSSRVSSSVYTSTSSTPPAKLSAPTTEVIGQSSGLSGSTSLALPSQLASGSGSSPDSEDCECDDETSTVYMTIPTTSQGLQASVANEGYPQPTIVDTSAGAASLGQSEQATGSLPSSQTSSIASQPSLSGPIPPSYGFASSGSQSLPLSQLPAAPPHNASGATSPYGSPTVGTQTQPISQATSAPSYGLSEALSSYGTPSGSTLSQSASQMSLSPYASLGVGSAAISSALETSAPILYSQREGTLSDSRTTSYTTVIISKFTTVCPSPTHLTVNNRTYTITSSTTLTITDCPCTLTHGIPQNTSSTGAVPPYFGISDAPQPSSGISNLANSMGFISGYGMRPKGNDSKFTNTSSTDEASSVNHSETNDYLGSVSVQSMPTISVSSLSLAQHTTLGSPSESSSSLVVSPTGYSHSTTSMTSVLTSSSKHDTNSIALSLFTSQSSAQPVKSALSTANSSSIQSTPSLYSTATSERLSSYSEINSVKSSPTSMDYTHSSHSSIPTIVTKYSSPTPISSTTHSSFVSPSSTHLTHSSSSIQLTLSSPTSTSKTTSSLIKASSTSSPHPSFTSHSPSTTSHIQPSVTSSASPTLHSSAAPKPSTTTHKSPSTSTRLASSTCSRQLTSPTPTDCICGEQGDVATPALLQKPTSCEDVETCRDQCLDKSTCASFSYCESTKQCQMYSKSLQEQGGVSQNNNGVVNYHRDCFETACTTYGAAKSTTSVPAWRFGWRT